jgi:uncharacterized membrane protein YeaQ/YmgE (transglycosylase-associated protein family)
MSKDDLANTLGWVVIVIGIIGSFLAGNAFKVMSYNSLGYGDVKFNFGITISGIVVSILFGLIFILIGEILNTEYENKEKIAHLSDMINNTVQSGNSNNLSN